MRTGTAAEVHVEAVGERWADTLPAAVCVADGVLAFVCEACNPSCVARGGPYWAPTARDVEDPTRPIATVGGVVFGVCDVDA